MPGEPAPGAGPQPRKAAEAALQTAPPQQRSEPEREPEHGWTPTQRAKELPVRPRTVSLKTIMHMRPWWENLPECLTDYTEKAANRLAAAKPALWRGHGELPRRPWELLRRGLWLILDLWGGISSTTVAALALGVRCIVLHVDTAADATQCATAAMPNVVHIHRVEDVNAGVLSKVCTRRTFEGCLVGGGSPCQGNTFLNPHRQGINDERSQQPEELVRIADCVHDKFGIPTVRWLENAASAPYLAQGSTDRSRGCSVRLRATQTAFLRAQTARRPGDS